MRSVCVQFAYLVRFQLTGGLLLICMICFWSAQSASGLHGQLCFKVGFWFGWSAQLQSAVGLHSLQEADQKQTTQTIF